MAPVSATTREAAAPSSHTNPAHPPASRSTHSTGRPIPARPARAASDDEILGLSPTSRNNASAVGEQHAVPGDNAWLDDAHSATAPTAAAASDSADGGDPAIAPAADRAAEPEQLRATLDANPDLRRAWDDAQAYRETFSSPEDARTAGALLADLDRMDALFFSRRPEDHAELARAVASLDPAAFASLAQAMAALTANRADASRSSTQNGPVGAQQEGLPGRRLVEPGRSGAPGADARRDAAHPSRPPVATRTTNQTQQPPSDSATETNGDNPDKDDSRPHQEGLPGRRLVEPGRSGAPLQTQPTSAQTEFFHATNAAAVQSVLASIESQVERLLPEGVSKSARNRVVGEIYRELDSTLRSNRQLAQQMRDAFRSGALDSDHQHALVSLVTGRARQALPGVAKRVLNEWTSTIVAANNDRRTRQRAAEHRVDIAGSSGTGSDGQRSMAPRDIDYRRMSDSDILNL